MSENHTPDTAEPLQETGAVDAQNAPSPVSRLGAFLSHPKAPLAVGAVVLIVAGAVTWHIKGSPASLLPIGRPSIVTFDPVKFTNAQRAAASILAASKDADVALSLTQVAKQAEPVIREEAHGAVVLVKQAVVAPDSSIPDITNAVLARFGLPTNVPTVTTPVGNPENLEDIAPTDSAFSAGKLREDYRMELDAERAKAAAAQAKQDKQSAMIP
ncbi:type-F conjugative transfer system protein TrbI [Burkholderia multivorans]|jgi:hypothetical protein|uniref:type-F conjugative transfer system protein TrbI n=1 Tax=Burkholderia multivorans TaxID=87883 RepID=UPI001C2134FE|nr:type-F conjugative transfer system protein TrbI [Burkholderia multivorans]MBU9199804.1 type-F conjugative transfer system protein TrbI [Burkholderia multivorans]MDN8079077.1 type-F conjugative transfer system protein TrbI [Burkholderia multivorans]